MPVGSKTDPMPPTTKGSSLVEPRFVFVRKRKVASTIFPMVFGNLWVAMLVDPVRFTSSVVGWTNSLILSGIVTFVVELSGMKTKLRNVKCGPSTRFGVRPWQGNQKSPGLKSHLWSFRVLHLMLLPQTGKTTHYILLFLSVHLIDFWEEGSSVRSFVLVQWILIVINE